MAKATEGILTFHTNGEDPDWVHDWATTSRMLEGGKPFHSTQLGLIDSFHVRHSYDRFLLVDGPNEFLFESDGDRWVTDWTTRQLRKAHRITHMWKTAVLDGKGCSFEPWDRSLMQRRAAMSAFLPSPAVGGDGRPLTATFHACDDGDGHTAIHGWLSTRVLIGMGMPFSTTQMGLLCDAQLLRVYDRIEIVEGDGDIIALCREGEAWESDRTERVIRPSNNLFALWRNGEFG